IQESPARTREDDADVDELLTLDPRHDADHRVIIKLLAHGRPPGRSGGNVRFVALSTRHTARAARPAVGDPRLLRATRPGRAPRSLRWPPEIGRASCRDRV